MEETIVKPPLHMPFLLRSFKALDKDMEGLRTPAHLEDLATLTRDLRSAVRIRSTQQLLGSVPMEHQAPVARARAGYSSSQGFEPNVRATQSRTPGTGGSEGAIRRTSERLRNLRLDFGGSQGSPSVSQDSSSSPAGDKNGGQSGSMDHSHSGPVIPATALRKNITQRRSNGRARDSIGSSTSVPVSELIARVPKVRLQDAAYANETRSHKPSTPVTSPGSKSPVQHTDASSSFPDFTRKQIPTELESPKLHKTLRAMWIRKKGIEKDHPLPNMIHRWQM
jgi:hypothetical protein